MRSIVGLVGVRLPRPLPLCAAALAVLSACDVPQAPQWDVGVLLPFSSDPIAIVDLLPSQVDTGRFAGQPVFVIDAQADSVGYSLGQMCSTCGPLQGLTVPVPAFDYADSLEVLFDPDLVSIEVAAATLGLQVWNGLNFDVLRPHPNPDSAGYIALVTRDIGSGLMLDSVVVSGATSTFPPGTTRRFELAVSGVQLTEGVRTFLFVHSPFDGQTVTIDTTMGARITTSLDQIAVTAVTGVVDADTIDESFAVNFDADTRSEIDNRVQDGSFELELTHTVEVNGTLEVSIAGSPADLFSGSPATEVNLGTFDFSFAPDGRVATRQVSAAELDLIAGLPAVYVGYRGVTTGMRSDARNRPIARFTPDQSIETRFRVTARVRVGG